VPKSNTRTGRTDPTREEVVRALLYPDRAEYDELGRTGVSEPVDDWQVHSSPREQGAAPLDLDDVDE
jgi:hypothetical protein